MVAQSVAQVLKEVGGRVRRARERAGLTQEQAAARADIGYKRYQAIEAGAVNVTVRTLVRIAHALRVNFWGLLGRR